MSDKDMTDDLVPTSDVRAELVGRTERLRAEYNQLAVRQREIVSELSDLAVACRVFGVAIERPTPALLPGGTVRETVLARLREAGAEGLCARDLGKNFAQPLHPKTIGMTLHRLMKDGHCQRINSRTWVAT